jgi:hypothetical protein
VTEGQRLLIAVPGPRAEIARVVGVTRQLVGLWIRGARVPGPGNRVTLQTIYGIPDESWSVMASEDGAAPQPSPAVSRRRPSSSEPRPPSRPTMLGGEAAVDGIGPTQPPEYPSPAKRGRAPRAALDTSEIPDSAEAVERLLSSLLVAIDQTNISPAERLKLNDSLIRIVGLKHKLEQARELQEDRIVRSHPAWKRIRHAVLEALRPHPDALRAVIDALKASGDDA